MQLVGRRQGHVPAAAVALDGFQAWATRHLHDRGRIHRHRYELVAQHGICLDLLRTDRVDFSSDQLVTAGATQHERDAVELLWSGLRRARDGGLLLRLFVRFEELVELVADVASLCFVVSPFVCVDAQGLASALSPEEAAETRQT